MEFHVWLLVNCFVTFWPRSLLYEQIMDSHAAAVWRIADYSTVFLTIYRQRQRYCLRRCVYGPTVVISEWQSVSGQLSIDGWVPCWRLDNCFETFWTRNLLAEQMLEFHSCCMKKGRLFCNILDQKLTFWADGSVPRLLYAEHRTSL